MAEPFEICHAMAADSKVYCDYYYFYIMIKIFVRCSPTFSAAKVGLLGLIVVSLIVLY